MNAAIATGFALFAGNAFAADAGASVTSIGFESTPQGQLDVTVDDQGGGGTTYWNDDGDDESTIVTNYTDTAVTKPDNRPDLFAGTENNIFLKIDSPNGIERYMAADYAEEGSVSLDNDYFVDMNVQFTVSDTVLDLGENENQDKLAIWLYAPDTEGATTNLVITAAELNEDKEAALKNFVIGGVDIQPDTWYRLTVKAVGEDGFPPKFSVYIDEDKLEAVATLAADGTKSSLDDAVSDFYSLVEYNGNKPTTYTLSSVTFQGVGALDDLAFTTTPPEFTKEVVTYNFSATIGEQETFADTIGALVTAGANEITLLADEYDISGEAATGLEVTGTLAINLNGKTLTFADTDNPAVTVTGSFTLAGTGTLKNTAEGGMAFIVAGGSLVIGTSAEDDVTVVGRVVGYSEAGYSIKYFSSTEPELAVVNEAGDTLAWAQGTGDDANYWVVSSGEEPPTPAGDLDPASGKTEVTVKAGTAAAAEAAAKAAIKVPAAAAEAVTAAEYAEYFTYSKVDNGNGTFTVAIEGIVEDIEEAVLESAVERLTDDEATIIEVPAGLYYSITPSTALPISGEAVKGLSTGGTVSVGKPGTAAGFYEIKLSPTEIK